MLTTVKAFVAMTDRAHMPKANIPNLLCYEELLAAQDDDYEWPTFDERTASCLCYTSGTTGNPEGRAVQPPLDHAARLCGGAAGCAEPLGARRDPAGGADVPRQRLGPAVFLRADRRQAGVPRRRTWTARACTSCSSRRGVTMSAGVPTVWLGLLNYMKEQQAQVLAR